MKLLIIGATGFLGSKLFKHASINKNFTVFGTSRFQNEEPAIIQVDVTNKQSILKAIIEIEPDVVIWTLMSFEEERKIINIGLKNLLLTLKSETKLVFLSTDAVFVEGIGGYKESDLTGILPEDAPLAEYVNGKYIGEKLILNRHPNHVIIRSGPLYSDKEDRVIEKRTLKIIEKLKENQQIKAASNVYRTFVNVNDLSSTILELSMINFNGILHVGPKQKESYYTFYKKRLKQLGWNNELLISHIVSKSENPLLSLDTSLNTQKAHQLLSTNFLTL
jgi:dTDP-4-dehydrorhamnose reductase